jgi:hypothetical protein
VVVEAGLADGDDARLVEQPAQLVEPLRLAGSRLVRIDPEGGVDAVGGGELERATAGVDPGPDRDHARDACHAGALEGCVGILERVEVRVGVDHAGASGSMRGKSGCDASIPDSNSVRP